TGRKNGNRVLRGGSWNNNDDNLRCANRNNNKPADTNNNNGFRLASTFDAPELPGAGPVSGLARGKRA
ncbi:MAG: SUMF1/EgtB/PvdO family nonheme iron enzyme, partial [Planctomycetota bacterium]